MTTRFAELPIEQLEIHPKNVRRDVGIVTDLANSITAQGIMQPFVVAPVPETPGFPELNGRYIIIAGHRRHTAAKLAGIDVVPCVIREDLDTEPKQLEAMLVENTQRTDLTVMEEARAYQAILDFPGYNLKTVSKAVGRSQKLIKDRAKLTTIPDAAVEKLEAKQMTLDDAMVFADFADDEKATQRLLDAHGTYNWNWEVRNVKHAREAAQRITESTTKLTGLGATIIERPENLNSKESEWVSARSYAEYEDFDSAQHIAAGHTAVVDRDTSGLVLWLMPADQAPERPEETEPELTPEQLADQQRREEIKAGLSIAAHVRHEHLRSRALEPTQELLDYVRELRIKQMVKGLEPSELEFYLNLSRDSKPAVIRECLEQFTQQQLDVLQLIVGNWYAEQELLSVSGWGPSQYGSDYAKGWREKVTGVFGYELSDIERQAIEYVAEKRAAEAETKEAAGAEDDEDEWEDEDDE
ncbi:ParB/RepB/Spo0J family partition protein [Arthrobacter silvisoli]|uniref:ParB/RepB/Spo0J family partition protein n=1 Tax=Arthrobacter silvisoli TaxID=2291022 RepID=UPI000E2183CD|nr:ParB/RepB/Spo0J family partition protein [Arthrobacter silvisoli]